MPRILPFVPAPLESGRGAGYVGPSMKGDCMHPSIRPIAAGGGACAGWRPQAGFTLIELMVTLAVIAILALVAVPATQSLVNGNRLAGVTGDLTAAVQLARSEAIRRSARVTMCRSEDGSTCANGTDWDRWIIIGRDNATGRNDIIRDVTVAAPVRVVGPDDGLVFRSSGILDEEERLVVCIDTSNPADNRRSITVLISGAITAGRESGDCPP